MRIRHALMAAALVASPIALTAPAAQAAGSDPARSIRMDGFASVEPGGGWSEGSVTVRNDTDQVSADHVLVYFGSEMIGVDEIVAEYADGASGAWQPLKLTAQDLGGKTGGHEGTAADLTGAGVEVQPHAERIFKLRFKLVQTERRGPATDFGVEAFIGPRLGTGGQAEEWVSRTGRVAKVNGLTTTIEGLPKSIPADGRPHPFKVSIKTANTFDWHLTTASFFLWAGQGVGSMEGPPACDAQVDVQDPKDGSWHRVGLGAVGMVGGTVDVAKWAAGPVDHKVLNARITLGRNFKLGSSDPELGFGYYPGAGPVTFWTTQPVATTPVDGAPDCVNPDAPTPSVRPTTTTTTTAAPAPTATGSVAPSAAPSASTAPSATPSATPSVVKAAAKPSPTATGGRQSELADTGSSGSLATAGIAAALLAVGAAAVALTRRARRAGRG
ncbi:hypothetical protein ACFVVL_19865 [Kitasatospora sp. NPDC058115]|uniref:hypothetical protein n=1 Tax=Kitasatospora sp. NPDC058115 TaxID=3346347 RepID=UPI0036DE69CF